LAAHYNLPPIARIDEITEVNKSELPDQIRAEFPEATGGLQVKRTYLNTERGNEVLEALKTGALNEMSFGLMLSSLISLRKPSLPMKSPACLSGTFER
jgi:hypothetical protein